MTRNSMRAAAIGFALAISAAASAHPGHEPENLLHALAHELASPRGILALLILGVAAALWGAHKASTKK
ncbi:MAG: hypothetical protein ACRDAM_21315 [Casimicrobium sp.]